MCAEESGRARRAASGNGETRSAIPTPSFRVSRGFSGEKRARVARIGRMSGQLAERRIGAKQTQNRPSNPRAFALESFFFSGFVMVRESSRSRLDLAPADARENAPGRRFRRTDGVAALADAPSSEMAMPCCSASRPGDDAASHKRAYLFLFFVSLLASWILRDRVAVTSSVMPGLRGCGESKSASCDHEVVTRVSLGTAMFFLTLAVLMWDSPDTSSWRHARVHRGSWAVKVPAWIGSIVLAFFAPDALAAAYFQAARVGGAAFLLVQIIVLLGTAYETNERWLARATGGHRQNETNDEASRSASRDAFRHAACLLGATTFAYAFAAACLAYAFRRFVFAFDRTSLTCAFNATTLWTVVVVVAVTTALSLRREIKAGLFTSGAVAAYVAYQTLSALLSLPSDAKCASTSSDGSGLATGKRESLEIVALVLALAALAASVARAGSSHDAFGLPEMGPGTSGGSSATSRGEEDGDENKVTARRAARVFTTRAFAPSPFSGFGLRDVSLSDDEEQAGSADSRDSPTSEKKTHPAAATYFHLVFASASMYAAMALVGWQRVANDVQANALDVGWGSVWVKIGAAIVASALYAWTLIAPVVFPNREF